MSDTNTNQPTDKPADKECIVKTLLPGNLFPVTEEKKGLKQKTLVSGKVVATWEKKYKTGEFINQRVPTAPNYNSSTTRMEFTVEREYSVLFQIKTVEYEVTDTCRPCNTQTYNECQISFSADLSTLKTDQTLFSEELQRKMEKETRENGPQPSSGNDSNGSWQWDLSWDVSDIQSNPTPINKPDFNKEYSDCNLKTNKDPIYKDASEHFFGPSEPSTPD